MINGWCYIFNTSMFEIQTSHSGVLTWVTRGTKRKIWLVKQGSSGSSRSPSQHIMHAFDCLTWIWRMFFNFNDLKFSLFTQLCVSIPMTLYLYTLETSQNMETELSPYFSNLSIPNSKICAAKILSLFLKENQWPFEK